MLFNKKAENNIYIIPLYSSWTNRTSCLSNQMVTPALTYGTLPASAMHWIKNYMCCNGKKWVLQKASLKIFEVILISTGSIATYSMSVMFPGTKNRAQKITSKHWNACFYTDERTTNPSDPSEKAAHIPCAAFFMSPGVLKPRNAVCQAVRLPLLLEKPSPALAASGRWEGEAGAGSVGCRACPSRFQPGTPEGGAVPLLPGTAQRCAAAPVGRDTEHSWPGSTAAHLLSYFSNSSFLLSTLATGNEEWTDLKDMIVQGVYSKTFP